MLPSSASASQPIRRVGVGIDTSRYGHYACFLGDDLQPTAAELSFAESAAGYEQIRQRLQHIAQRQGPVQFVIRLDAAGQYGDNLLHYLHSLGTPGADADPARGVDFLRRSATQQELPRRTVRQQEVGSL